MKCVLTSTTKNLPKWGFEQVRYILKSPMMFVVVVVDKAHLIRVNYS